MNRMLLASLFMLYCATYISGQGFIYQVSFDSLEAGANYIDSAAVGDVLFTEDQIDVSMVDSESSNAVFYEATDEILCTDFRDDNIHMFYAGGLLFDIGAINEDINYIEFLYNWDCNADPVEIDVDNVGTFFVEDTDLELIIANTLYVARFNDFLSVTGPMEQVTIAGVELGLDNVTFREATADCHILNLDVTAECTGQEDDFFATLFFDHVETSDSFQLTINSSVFGRYAYSDLPVQVGPLDGDNMTQYMFRVQDVLDSGCNATRTIGPIFCEPDNCEISNTTVETGICTNRNAYPITVDFDVTEPLSLFFDVNSSQGYLGFFRYSRLPLNINFPFSENEEEWIIVSDDESSFCADTVFFAPAECPDETQCVIHTMDLTVVNCFDSTFELVVDMVADGAGDFFDLAVGADPFTTYEYDSLPITIGPFAADSMTNYSITAIDVQDASCNIVRRVRPVTCGLTRCNIRNMQVITTECDGEIVDAILDFDATAGVSDSFTLLLNNFPQDNYAYTEVPLALDPLVGDGSSYTIGVRDSNNECDNFWQTGPITCPPCDVEFAIVNLGDCQSNRTIPVTFDLDIENASSTDFILETATGDPRTFRYADLPITINYFIDEEVDANFLRVTDAENMECGDEVDLNIPDCRSDWCNITGISVEPRPCTGNTYGVNLDFRFRNTGDRFRVRGENRTLGIFNYTDLPVAVGPFTAEEGRMYTVVVEDLLDPEVCTDSLTFESFECDITANDELTHQGLSIFPNPATDLITLNVQDRVETVSLVSIDGVRQVTPTHNIQSLQSSEGIAYQVDISSVMPGMYVLYLSLQDGNSAQARFLKY